MRKLIAIIDTKKKSPEKVSDELMKALDKYNRSKKPKDKK